MKIPFENWINSKIETGEISDESAELFNDAIKCYKFSSYRAAFLMSYIGFQKLLRRRILVSPNHNNIISKNDWDKYLKSLRDDNEWDMRVAKCVCSNPPDKVFTISRSIITEYEYYRVIRNKCAHGKEGKIEYFHVESLWTFIQENFYKFVINSGENAVMKLIENHYDKTKTALGKDPTYIVESIQSSISDSDLNDLLKLFYNYCEESDAFDTGMFNDDRTAVDLWDKLVTESDDRIHNSIICVIKEKDDYLSDFVARYPATASEFLSDSSFARQLWQSKLKKLNRNTEGLMIFIEKLIGEGHIPDNEKQDFSKKIFECLGYGFPQGDKNIGTLKRTEYFNLLHDDLFNINNYNQAGANKGIIFANKNVYHIVSYIKCFGLDIDSVKCINEIFSFATFGDFYYNIKKLMKNDKHYDVYKNIVKDNDMVDHFSS